MTHSPHYVIIGNGVSGNEAAWHLRQRDPDSRITVITAGKLLFINRYELPKLFSGVEDWRQLLVHPPAYYEEERITLRRNTWVSKVDAARRVIALRHKEEVSYDKLLVASGGGGYLPEDLSEYRHLMHGFTTFSIAIRMRRALSDGGRALMLGGDILGLDLARSLIGAGYEVIVVANEHLFKPHEVAPEERPRFVEALKHMGMKIIEDRKVSRIEEGAKGMPARRLVFEDGGDLHGDVVMPFCGLMPSLGFMVGAGVDIERGLLVNPQLCTPDGHIWAAGDVCQIWSPEENQYRFYYGWKNVKMMGRIAAVNMTGGDEAVSTLQDDRLHINERSEIDSPFWEHD